MNVLRGIKPMDNDKYQTTEYKYQTIKTKRLSLDYNGVKIDPILKFCFTEISQN